jgi:hypothetical protein
VGVGVLDWNGAVAAAAAVPLIAATDANANENSFAVLVVAVLVVGGDGLRQLPRTFSDETKFMINGFFFFVVMYSINSFDRYLVVIRGESREEEFKRARNNTVNTIS